LVPNNRLEELLEDWKFLIRRDGAKHAIPAVGLEIARLPFRHLRFLIIARSLIEPLPDLKPKIELEIRPFEAADVKIVKEIDRPSEATASKRRLGCQQLGLLASFSGRPAGYAWACSEIDSTLERVQFDLLPGDALCVDAYTVPAFRGKGVQTALTLARCKMLRDLGYLRAIAYIEIHNYPSLAVWRKLGGLEIGQIDFLRIGPWYCVQNI
jgi:GNAT superfamily N-acetyltransferase